MKRIFYFSLLVLLSFSAFAQKCPPEGSAKKEKEKELNRGKNISAKIPNLSPTLISIDEILSSKKDATKYSNGDYVQIIGGYLVSYEEQGAETCNCKKASKKNKTGDIHIYIGKTKDAEKKNCMVIEITPSWKKLHPDYDLSSLKNKKVVVTGYMLYDNMHEANSLNYCKTCRAVWRKTCWEVHPITDIRSEE